MSKAETDKTTTVQMVDIDEDDSGQRLDNYLFRVLKGVPKSRVYRALRGGEVRVNKGRVKPDYRLKAGDVLRIPPVRQAERTEVHVAKGLLAELEAAILFENDDFLVVNKPSGLAVHGGSGLKFGLIEAFRQLRPNCKRLELAHRLDRDTSGCTIIVKKASALRAIHQQLREKHMEKTYLALVKGRWPRRRTVVDIGLEKNVLASGERMVYSSPEGKPSKTLFAISELLDGATLIEAKPVTGRTHQIRVHAKYAGFPLLGDDKYGNREDAQWLKKVGLKRLFLHASRVKFKLPGYERPFVIDAPLPKELKAVVKGFKGSEVVVLVVFDWDGTLMDSAAKIVACMQEAARECGLDALDDLSIKNIIGLGLPEAILTLYPAVDAEIRDLVRKEYSKAFIAADAKPCEFFEGVEDCLDGLLVQGHSIAVATGKSRKGLARVLGNVSWQDKFHATRCADETASKPNPLMLLELMQELKYRPSDTIMVGDTEYDLEMAANAKIRSIGVDFGAHTVDRLQKHSPVGIVDSVLKVSDFLV